MQQLLSKTNGYLFICLLLLFFLVSALCGGLYRTPRETSPWLMGLSCQKLKFVYLSIYRLGDKAGAMDNSVLRELFLQRLPANVRMVLASTADQANLENLAQLADKVVEV